MTEVTYNSAAVPATEKQLNFIRSLMDERELTAEQRKEADRQIAAGLGKQKASKWIERLLALPKAAKAKNAPNQGRQPEVAPGRYALENPSDPLNPVRFYKVNEGQGRWEGFLFVGRYASDDLFAVKGGERFRVLREIAADPLAALQLFGRERGDCGVCGRSLTRVLSRELGIGPVCGARMGSAFGVLRASAAERLAAEGIDLDAETEDQVQRWAKYKGEFATREAAQERLVYEAEAEAEQQEFECAAEAANERFFEERGVAGDPS